MGSKREEGDFRHFKERHNWISTFFFFSFFLCVWVPCSIAKHVAMWIEAGGSLLLGDSSFKQFLAQLQQRLAKDELLSEQETLRRAVTTATQANSAWLETASRLEAARPDTPSRDPHHYLVVESPVHKQSPLGSPRQSPMASPIMRRSLQSPPVGESPTMRRRENFMQTMRSVRRSIETCLQRV